MFSKDALRYANVKSEINTLNSKKTTHKKKYYIARKRYSRELLILIPRVCLNTLKEESY